MVRQERRKRSRQTAQPSRYDPEEATRKNFMNKVRRGIKKFTSKPKYDAMKRKWAEERAKKQELGADYTGEEYSTGNEYTDRELIKTKPMNAW